jgi:hypothetical protein
MIVQFAVNAYRSRSLPAAAQECINYFAEALPADAKTQVIVYNAPGTKAFGSGGLAGVVRGVEKMAGVLYGVAGNTLYSVDSSGTATNLGEINTTAGDVSFAVNRASPQELCFVDGTDGWTYDTGSGLVQITDGDFTAADTVTFQDGYFAFNRAGTSIFFISGLNDGQSYDALDFADAEGSPDEIVAVFSSHRELWIFGQETIEVYFNSGNADFPFERINGAYIERGCAAAFSVASDDNTLFWLGEDGVVYRANGYTPQRISTHAIEEDIRKFSSIADAKGYFLTIAGHKFYHLTFPTGKKTYVYDVSTGLWHERKSVDSNYWRGGSAGIEIYGKCIVGDAFQGRLGELDMDTFSEYGGVMQGVLTGPVVHDDRKRLFHKRFELDIESGVGDTSGDASDPQMWMDYSDDGGRTFSLRKPFRSMGKIGEYQARLRWLRLGMARNRIYRVTVADAVKRSIINTHLDASVGSN